MYYSLENYKQNLKIALIAHELLEELKHSNSFLAKKLEKKIENYKIYIDVV